MPVPSSQRTICSSASRSTPANRFGRSTILVSMSAATYDTQGHRLDGCSGLVADESPAQSQG